MGDVPVTPHVVGEDGTDRLRTRWLVSDGGSTDMSPWLAPGVSEVRATWPGGADDLRFTVAEGGPAAHAVFDLGAGPDPDLDEPGR